MDIVGDLEPKRFQVGALFEGGARDQVEGSDPNVRLSALVNAAGLEPNGKKNQEQSDQGRLPKSSGLHVWCNHKMITIENLLGTNGSSKTSGFKDDVGVGEQDERLAGLFAARMKGVEFAQPSAG